MFAIADSQNATAQERQRALSTIADALFYRPHKDKYGMDLAESERDAAKEYPLLAREVERMNSQEATFADRLRNLMAKKNITQSELAAQVDCSQSAIAHMLNRNSRPQKKTIFKLAQALKVQPTDLWPDLEVAEILDSIANFQEERELTTAEAKSLQTAMDQPPAKSRGKRLPSRKEKR